MNDYCAVSWRKFAKLKKNHVQCSQPVTIKLVDIFGQKCWWRCAETFVVQKTCWGRSGKSFFTLINLTHIKFPATIKKKHIYSFNYAYFYNSLIMGFTQNSINILSFFHVLFWFFSSKVKLKRVKVFLLCSTSWKKNFSTQASCCLK